MTPPDLQRADVDEPEVFYPESDGKPMAETELHRDLMLELIEAARWHVRDEPDIHVTGNLLVYYEEGNPRASVAPDFFAVRGVPKGRRRIYKIWKEGKPPEVVIELTSPSTHREDLGHKRVLYERLGVLEYFIFDPEGRRFRPPLRAYRRTELGLTPVPVVRSPDGALRVTSEVLGLELWGRKDELRWIDPDTGERLPIPREWFERAEKERERAEREAARAEAAQARADAEQARAEAAQARAEAAQARADAEQTRAEVEQTHAKAEAARAEAAEAEAIRLGVEIAKLKGERHV